MKAPQDLIRTGAFAGFSDGRVKTSPRSRDRRMTKLAFNATTHTAPKIRPLRPIENISVDGVYADDCYTFMRMLSVDSPIRGIKVSNVRCGVRCYGINMDAARYCRTPLFEEDDFPDGAGIIENVTLENIELFFSAPPRTGALICAESLCRNYVIKNLRRSDAYEAPTLLLKKVAGISCGGKRLESKGDELRLFGSIDNISIGR